MTSFAARSAKLLPLGVPGAFSMSNRVREREERRGEERRGELRRKGEHLVRVVAEIPQLLGQLFQLHVAQIRIVHHSLGRLLAMLHSQMLQEQILVGRWNVDLVAPSPFP